MASEVEETFPSFSTERIRSKVQIRDGSVTQRRLDYNAPLLSVRRLADAGGDAKSKVWKLSAELCKEPLRVPGAVPFTWEHSPGRPKQPESPPRAPSSPSPPSTPSPPSARRASPASPTLPPPPPPLRPLFLRSNSSTLFAPPPPPPPPPPPLPPAHPLPIQKRKTVPHVGQPLSYSASPPPPPPPPPPRTHRPTVLQGSTQSSTILVSKHLPDHERMGAFRLVDPTEGFLRALRARRLKAEPEEFLPAEVSNEAVEASPKAAAPAEEVEETLRISAKCGLSNDGIAEVASINDNSSCVAVDAIVQRFLAEHPDVATEEAASVARQDDETMEQDDQASLDAVNSVNLPCQHSKHDTVQQSKDITADANNPCSIIPSKEDAAYISVVHATCSDEVAEELQKVEPTLRDGLATEYVPSATWENGGSVCAPVSPSMDPQEVKLDAGHKQSLIKKQQNIRCTSSIAILDSCRAESLQMIKSTLLEFCRKAAAASLRTLAKAKRKLATSRRSSSSPEVVVHPNVNSTFHEGRSDQEEEAVVSEVKTIVQEQFSQEAEQQEVLVSQEAEQQDASVWIPHCQPIISPRSSHSQPITSPTSSMGILQESTESNLCDNIHTDAKRVCTPISSPKPSSPLHETNEADKKDIISSPPHHSLNGQGSPGLQPPQQEETLEIWSRASSARHIYSKSLGGDEPNEFYDASSRFGSRGSTPSRLLSNRSMSKDWFDDFLDATSTPFETPRTSVSDIRYAISNADFSPSKASKSTRPTSKLSKRVGKSLWVETREINATGEVDAISKDELKGFISGEMYAKSNESGLVLNKKEVNDTRRKWVSGDQASSSTSQARRQYKRGASRSVNARSSSHAIAVTPVFPSKCQKNRSIASASGLPQQISIGSMEDIGWPLGISGYPPLKTCTKGKEESKERGASKGENNVVVPLPPLPASPAGGSWLRKALSSNHAPSRLAGLNAVAKKVEASPRPGNKWEDIVKGSHVQPGHLRFSEELQHHPPSNATSTKYYVS